MYLASAMQHVLPMSTNSNGMIAGAGDRLIFLDLAGQPFADHPGRPAGLGGVARLYARLAGVIPEFADVDGLIAPQGDPFPQAVRADPVIVNVADLEPLVPRGGAGMAIDDGFRGRLFDFAGKLHSRLQGLIVVQALVFGAVDHEAGLVAILFDHSPIMLAAIRPPHRVQVVRLAEEVQRRVEIATRGFPLP